MSTITTLITGGTKEERTTHIESLKINLPYPPTILDGSDQNISIKEVRIFQSQIFYTPQSDTIQKHFILEAQNLTLPSQHALLKTLEEPPKATQIIITADHPHSLLDTILSRCLHKPLKEPTRTPESNILKDILNMNHGQLIDYAKNLTKNNPQKSLNNLLTFLRQGLVNHPTSSRHQAVKLTNEALKDLKTNISQQIILEHLFFSLKSLADH